MEPFELYMYIYCICMHNVFGRGISKIVTAPYVLNFNCFDVLMIITRTVVRCKSKKRFLAIILKLIIWKIKLKTYEQDFYIISFFVCPNNGAIKLMNCLLTGYASDPVPIMCPIFFFQIVSINHWSLIKGGNSFILMAMQNRLNEKINVRK